MKPAYQPRILDRRVAELVEVKASVAVDGHDIRHLAWLRDELGQRFVQGLVLHTGPRLFQLADRITAAPISTLWS